MNSYMFALLAMIMWGIAPVFGKLGLANLEPLTVIAVRSVTVSLILVFAVIFTGKWTSFAAITGTDFLYIFLEGLCAALLGQLAYFYALKYGEVSRVTLVVAAAPLCALAISILFLGEKLTLLKLLGGILIIGGIILLKL